MRPTYLALASAAAAAAVLSAATAAAAQSAQDLAQEPSVQTGGRTLSWPGKGRAPVARPVAPPPSAYSYDPVAVPEPFTASSARPNGVNNRYSARASAPRMAMPTRPAYAPPPFMTSAPMAAPLPRPVYAPPPMAAAPTPMPEPVFDYGPPVIPNIVKPVRAPAAAAPVAVQPAPVMVQAPAPAPRARAAKAGSKATSPAVPVAPAPAVQATAGGDRPFVRPASPNGPRFYSVHREFGGTPDATLRSAPSGAATERLPSAFFASNAAPDEAEDEPQDDAETRAAALRAAEKAEKAKKGGKRR